MKIKTESTRQWRRPIKTWWDCVKGDKGDTESFGLSCEDAQDRDHCRIKMKGKLADPGLPGKWPLNGEYVFQTHLSVSPCVYVWPQGSYAFALLRV